MCLGLHRYSASAAQRATAASSDGHNSATASATHFGFSSSSGSGGGSNNDSTGSAASGGSGNGPQLRAGGCAASGGSCNLPLNGPQLNANGCAGRSALKVKDYPASSDFKQELPDHMQVCVCSLQTGRFCLRQVDCDCVRLGVCPPASCCPSASRPGVLDAAQRSTALWSLMACTRTQHHPQPRVLLCVTFLRRTFWHGCHCLS